MPDFLNVPIFAIADEAADNCPGDSPQRDALVSFAGLVTDNAAHDGASDRTAQGTAFGIGIIGGATGDENEPRSNVEVAPKVNEFRIIFIFKQVLPR